MTWCIANQYTLTNPVSSVTALLPKQKPKHDIAVHFPAAHWRDLPAIRAPIFSDKQISVGKQALLFLILTAARVKYEVLLGGRLVLKRKLGYCQPSI